MADSATVAGLPVGTVTFLMTDVEGSTRAWESDEASMRQAMARHEEILDRTISRHAGNRPREQGEGDSVVAVFARAADAVAAALEAQVELATTPLRVRMGLHTGDADVDEGATSYSGPTIIRAARLRSLGHGGQILLSRATADMVADRLPPDVELIELGSHRLKGLSRAEQVFQLTHPQLRSHFPVLAADRAPTNLPAELTTFVGRGAEMAAVAALLHESRLVTLTGAGGCGKTRLAARVAATQADSFPDGLWWVELGPLADPEAVDQAIASAMGVPEQTHRSFLDAVADHLAHKRALLVLDNCEHLLGPCSEWVTALASRCPEVVVLATSREALGVGGEMAWRVPSMSLPAPGDDLQESDAIELFAARASVARRTFRLDTGNVSTVAEICRRLDGMPLAIELAAARIRILSPDQIAAALSDRFRLLAGGVRTAVRRQQTLRASVDWSYGLLGDQEATLLRRLAVFAGGFTLDAVEAVCSGEGIEPYAVLDLLTSLADKSLVVVEDLDGESRYRLLETIRQYAGERLLESAEMQRRRDRHLQYFLSASEEGGGLIADHAAWMDRVTREHDNFEVALEWAISSRDVASAVRLTVALTPFWVMRGHFRQGRRWSERVLELLDDADPRRAWALWPRAALGGYGGSLEAIATFAGEAVASAREAGDDSLTARCLNLLGFRQMWSDPAAARTILAEAKTLAQRVDDGYALGEALGFEAWSWSMQDNKAGVLAAAEQIDRLAADRHDPSLAASSRMFTVVASIRSGDLARARRALEEAWELTTDQNPMTYVFLVLAEADVDLLTGDYGRARAALDESLTLVKRSGAGAMTSVAATQLAFVHLAEGDTVGARALVEKYLAPSRNQGADFAVMLYTLIEGIMLLIEGKLTDATSSLDQSRALAERFGDPWFESLASQFLGFVALFGGDPGAAETLHHKALALRVAGGYLPSVIESLEDLAGIALQQESPQEATRLWAATAAARRSLGYPRRPGMLQLHELAATSCRKALGDDAFELAWKDGSALSLEEAVAYATRARGERKRPATGWASLTPTELKVVAAVRDGLANPDIGQRLFMSRSTVKTHLSHVFTKLGVTSRSELAAEAVRRGI